MATAKPRQIPHSRLARGQQALPFGFTLLLSFSAPARFPKAPMPSLFDPTTAGDLQLANRIVMAPLTRSRAIGNVPNALTAQHYRQRARRD